MRDAAFFLIFFCKPQPQLVRDLKPQASIVGNVGSFLIMGSFLVKQEAF